MKILAPFLILSCILFSSCIVEHVEKPMRSQWARNIAFEASINWSNTLCATNIAHKANMWLLASDAAKYVIEDTYFEQYKLRLLEDIIIIKGLCRINTFGKPLNSTDAVWEVTMLDEYPQTTKVSYLNKDNLHTTMDNPESMTNDYFNNSLDVLFKNETLVVTGSGACHTTLKGNVKYKIDDKLTINNNNNNKFYERYANGVLLIELDDQTKISAAYNGNTVTINTDKYTDTYHIYY